jgi:regulator of protease activity HflC (stomatin/prohibitin superfamily)
VSAIAQVRPEFLRFIGKSDLDAVLCDREHLNQGMELMIDSLALDWGIHVEGVEIKDVALPEGMKRLTSRQRRPSATAVPRVTTADGEVHSPQEADAGCGGHGRPNSSGE